MNIEDLKKGHEELILLGYRGSVAHNLYVPPEEPMGTDDIDVMGVVVPSIDHYFGLEEFGSRGTKEIFEDEYDVVLYEVRKMVSLLLNGNPNVLSLLWLREQDYLLKTREGQLLLDHRSIFASKHVYSSFAGYANGQLHRMEHMTFQGYMGEKRKKLVEQFGYDTKNASHLIRLLRMCIGFLWTGELEVYRLSDREELLDIKNGKWSLEEVKTKANVLFDLAKNARDHSPLPNKPDRAKANELLVEIGWRKSSLLF